MKKSITDISNVTLGHAYKRFMIVDYKNCKHLKF